MEQHRTRQDRSAPRRGTPPLPPQAGSADARAARPGPRQARPGPAGSRLPQGSPRPPRPRPGAGGPGHPRRRPAGTRRPAPPLLRRLRRLPNPRLTGLGGGLFCAAVMLALGFLDGLLFGASLTVYGVLFLPVCVLTAVWVRRGDLMTGPVVVPIAFTAGLLPVAGGEGVGGRLMGLFTALATQAGWLYGGTLLTGVIVIARRLAHVRRRRPAGSRPATGP
ncbi:DUF6542 domain-containing protein [Streptomyces sp. NPDC093094]|uniref:DUF6542 domain-containing protein n=1 Tax=Streptomyces sp. NPDC093094 TaxID=3366026 RepID=UPI00382C2B75